MRSAAAISALVLALSSLASGVPVYTGRVPPVRAAAQQLGALPIALSTPGLVAVGCDNTPAPAPQCPAGQLVQVQAAFYGRDVAANASDPATCPGSVVNTAPCSLDARDSAALTAWVAGLCDGRQACAPLPGGWAVRTVFGDPCPSSNKIVRVTYACRNAALDPPAVPTQLPANDTLRILRPGTLASPKCPAYAKAFAAAANSGLPWQIKAQNAPQFARLALAFVDIKASDLDAAVRAATNNLYMLDTVAELNVTALNFDVGSNVTVIGKSNTGFTRVRIVALNVMASDGGALDVRSNGPDASGRFGPDVFVSAQNVFGQLRIMQNGLTAGHPEVASAVQSGSFCNPGPEFTDGMPCGSSYGDFQGSSCKGLNIITGALATFMCNPTGHRNGDGTSFQPLCVSGAPRCYDGGDTGDGEGQWCDGASVTWMRTDYYGSPLWRNGQNDSLGFEGILTDRFVYPGYNELLGKSNAYGTSKAHIAAFYTRDGTSASSQSAWNVSSSGMLSTADFIINLNRHPVASFQSTHDQQGKPYPQTPYHGVLDLMPGYADGSNIDDLVMAAVCSNDNAPYGASNQAWAGDGTISYTPAAASPAAYGTPDPLLARMVAGCADDMVSARRFADAEAFLADLAGALSVGDDPSVVRAFTLLADLRSSRKAIPVHPVPFLSASTLETAVASELAALPQLEGNLTAIAGQATTGAGAVQLLLAANATLQNAVDSAVIELQGDLAHVKMLQAAFDAINATYADRTADLDNKRQAFVAGVKKAEAAEIAEIVIEFLLDIAVAVATDGAGAAGIEQLATDSGSIAKLLNVCGKLDKLIPLLTNLGTIFYNTQQLVFEIMAIVNQIENLPSAPDITVDISAAINSNTTLASLTSALLNFQDLKDEATVYMGPAIAQGIDGADDYALALQGIGNAGIDLVGLQVQLLNAQIKAIQSGSKLQAAQQQSANIGKLVAQAQQSFNYIGTATAELALNLLDRKMRALDLTYQVSRAFAYANTETFTQPQGLPDPSTPALGFATAINDAINGLESAITLSQCFCNVSWIETDPVLIANLSTSGVGFLDFRDPSKYALRNFFGGNDNVHLLQINLKPYGIKANGTQIPGITPQLQLDIAPTGEFWNTFTDASGNRWKEQFLATPYTYSMEVEPTNGWAVTMPGSLSPDAAAKFYVPTVYGNFRISGDPNMVATWDWSGVWGLQVELWGYAVRAGPGQATATGCSGQCSTMSSRALSLFQKN
ncbi:hypothetical protein DFJ74DRAFT_685484 [Hyaloraphidium curvatum]|nr:hypothetical protein DFJ74DRAFT_685484 [Hyaloraphidium curvatum]